MKKIILLNKKEGETPLECLEVFRRKNKEYKNIKMTYAGRLDPMASGLLIVLADTETKNKEKYLVLNKEYEFEVLFGFATDTYDILGKVNLTPSPLSLIRRGVGERSELEKRIKQILPGFLGKWEQKYPSYSSKTVHGKPLFAYARRGEEVEMPSREVFVQSLRLVKIRKIGAEKLLVNIEKRIGKVEGDFRQKEILKIWQKELGQQKSDLGFLLASFKIKCGSGTYVRVIAHSLGQKLGIPALAYSIRRTKIGRYKI